MSAPLPTTALGVALARAARLIETRLLALEERLHDGDDAAWALYVDALKIALDIEARLAPGAHGELISTADLAHRLNVSSKTIARRRKAGALTPALVDGKRIIRWKALAQ